MIGTLLFSAILAAAPARAQSRPVLDAFPAPQRSTAPISIVYPAEGLALPSLKNEFVMGSVSNPKGIFSINGETVPVYFDGAFLAWLPVSQGSFTFHCRLSSAGPATVYDRRVFVAPEPKILPPSPLQIVSASILPNQDMALRAGDWLRVAAQATPKQKAWFRLPGLGWVPLHDDGAGFYSGAHQVAPGEEMPPAHIQFQVGTGWSAAEAQSRARVSFLRSTPRVAVVNERGDAILKTGPDDGNIFPVLTGMPLVVIGRAGADDKVRLSPDESGWIGQDHLQFLPPNSPPPDSILETVSTRPSDRGTNVLLSMTERVPFELIESEDLKSLVVRLFYTRSHDNWIIYRPNDKIVSGISFRQESSDVVDVRLGFKPGVLLWGVHPSFAGNAVALELRLPPLLARAPASPLRGVRVFLDPGHMPSAPGAIGPLGTKEMDVNYAIAQETRALLEKEGADVFVSRPDDQSETGLVERPQEAWDDRADVFVSVHNNNLGDGQDPFSGGPHGYSIFYYEPQSLALAKAVYGAYEKDMPIPGEDLRYGNLLVLRQTEMPSILTESAYMTFPDQEAMLLTPSFRKTIARSIVDGLRAFFAQTRRREQSLKRPLAARARRSKP